MSRGSSVGKVHSGHGPGSGPRRSCGSHSRHGGFDRFLRLDVEEMSPKARIVAALAVLAPVALSGVLLVAFAPGLWWVFTTYFWVAFPALGLLAKGISSLSEGKSEALLLMASRERELLKALERHGELTPAWAAMETSLSVSEADEMLKELAEAGHLEVLVRGGGLFYALWEGAERPTLQVHSAELREIGKTTSKKEVHTWPR
ncbi:MAG: hypothetical protein M3518_05155 [Actinomycetota bacterium]|nr:hypothetical protein [Actinomycetota bacterium]